MQISKPTLLLTRLEEESRASATRLRRRGWSVYRAPMLRLQAIAAPELGDGLVQAQAIALTSKSALRAFPAELLRREATRALRIYAVGEESAALAKSKGFIDVRTAGANVEALYELIDRQACKNRPIIHLCGKHTHGNLVARLQRNGYPAISIAIYEAVSAQSLPIAVQRMFNQTHKQIQVYASLIYSARSADIFAKLYAQAIRGKGEAVLRKPLRFFCLSPAIGARVTRHFPSAIIACAQGSSERSLLQTIDNFQAQVQA